MVKGHKWNTKVWNSFQGIFLKSWQNYNILFNVNAVSLPSLPGQQNDNVCLSVHLPVNELTSGVYTYSTWKAEDMNARAMKSIISIGILQFENIRFLRALVKTIQTITEDEKWKFMIASFFFMGFLNRLVNSVECVLKIKNNSTFAFTWRKQMSWSLPLKEAEQ